MFIVRFIQHVGSLCQLLQSVVPHVTEHTVQGYLLLTSQSDIHPVSREDFHLHDLVLRDHSCLRLSILPAFLKGLFRILLICQDIPQDSAQVAALKQQSVQGQFKRHV